jgi:hypothetical protein
MIKGFLEYVYPGQYPFAELPRELVLKILLMLADDNEQLVYDTIGRFPGHLARFRATIDQRFLEYRNLTRWYMLQDQWGDQRIPASFGLVFRKYKGNRPAKILVTWTSLDTHCTVHGKHLKGEKRMTGEAQVYLQNKHVCLRVELRECSFTYTGLLLNTSRHTLTYAVYYDRDYRVKRILYSRNTMQPIRIELEQLP